MVEKDSKISRGYEELYLSIEPSEGLHSSLKPKGSTRGKMKSLFNPTRKNEQLKIQFGSLEGKSQLFVLDAIQVLADYVSHARLQNFQRCRDSCVPAIWPNI